MSSPGFSSCQFSGPCFPSILHHPWLLTISSTLLWVSLSPERRDLTETSLLGLSVPSFPCSSWQSRSCRSFPSIGINKESETLAMVACPTRVHQHWERLTVGIFPSGHVEGAMSIWKWWQSLCDCGCTNLGTMSHSKSTFANTALCRSQNPAFPWSSLLSAERLCPPPGLSSSLLPHAHSTSPWN